MASKSEFVDHLASDIDTSLEYNFGLHKPCVCAHVYIDRISVIKSAFKRTSNENRPTSTHTHTCTRRILVSGRASRLR